MTITGTTDIGNGLLVVTVDHDPLAVATDAPAGSIIVNANGDHFRKLDSGATTNIDLFIHQSTQGALAQLSDSTNQVPGVTTPVDITFNTNDEIVGTAISHSETVNPEEITVNIDGIYSVVAQPQVGKTSGASKITFDMFIQKDTGSGFVDVPDSNVKLIIKDSDLTDVIILSVVLNLTAGDKIKVKQRVSDSSIGMGLQATAAEVGPPTIPATPSIIFAVIRIGGG